MERIRFVEHRGVRILCANYSGLRTAEELERVLEEAAAEIHAHPRGSLLILADLRELPYTLENVKLLRDAAVRNSPYVRARAVVGLPDIAQLSFRAVSKLTGRALESFATSEQAMDWLVEQA